MSPCVLASSVLLLAVAATGLAAQEAQAPTIAWRQPLAGWGEPALDAGSAYVLTRSHQVVAFDLATGLERWRVETGGPGEAPFGSVVRLTGSSVIVGDDAVIALDRITGSTRWRFVPRQGHGAGIFLGDADDRLVVAGSTSGHIYVLDTATGRLRWTARLVEADSAAVFQPVLLDEAVLVAYTAFGRRLGGGVAAYRRDGRRLWRTRLPDGKGVAGPPQVDGETVVVAGTDGVIEGLDSRNGRRQWTLPPARSGGRLARDIRPLAVAGNVLVAGSLTGTVTAYELATRRVRWRFDCPSGAVPLRLGSDGHDVYLPLTNGALVVLSAADGIERWRTGDGRDRVGWPPGVDGTRVVVVGERTLVAMESRRLVDVATIAKTEER